MQPGVRSLGPLQAETAVLSNRVQYVLVEMCWVQRVEGRLSVVAWESFWPTTRGQLLPHQPAVSYIGRSVQSTAPTWEAIG